MGYIENQIYNFGVRQRNKLVKSKTKTKTAVRIAKDAVRVGRNVIDSYDPPEVDPFTGVRLRPARRRKR